MYYFLIDNKYAKINIGPHTGTPDENLYFQGSTFSLNSTHNIFTLVTQANWNSKTVTVKNSFNSGNVKIDSETYPSGVSKSFGTPTFPHTLEAIQGQSSGGYVQAFNLWKNNQGWERNTIAASISATSATYTSDFSNQFNITFQNQFPDGSSGGVIKVNGNQINSPTSTNYIKEGEIISGGSVEQVINGNHYVFNNWNQDGGNNSSYNFLPSGHKNYEAIYNYCGLRHLTFNYGAPSGTPIKLYWHRNEVPNITQYQIWRKAGKTGTQQLIATVSASTSNYTDYDYVHSGGSGADKLLWYDVRYYCSSPSGWASPSYATIYGEEAIILPKTNKEDIDLFAQEEKIEDYSISSFPNPFNPVTNIYYKISKPGLVTIKVYDMLGKEVATLVNEDKPMGDFIIKFDGSKYASGIYFYTMQVNDFIQTQKMLLAK